MTTLRPDTDDQTSSELKRPLRCSTASSPDTRKTAANTASHASRGYRHRAIHGLHNKLDIFLRARGGAHLPRGDMARTTREQNEVEVGATET